MLVPVKIINITSISMNIAILLMYEYLSVASNESFEFGVFFSNSYTVLNFRYAEVMNIFSVDFFCIITTQKLNCFSCRKKESFCCQMGVLAVGSNKDWVF